MTLLDQILEGGIFRRLSSNDRKEWAPFGPQGDSRTTIICDDKSMLVGPGIALLTLVILRFDQSCNNIIAVETMSFLGSDP